MSDVLAQTLAALIQYLGATPILLFFAALILGPMSAMVWSIWKMNKILGKITIEQRTSMQLVFDRQDKRFEQVVRMYEDNVDLVKDYEKHVGSQRDVTEKLIDLIAVSTGTQQTLVDYIRNNLFCPLVRQRTKPDKIDTGGA